MSSEIYAKRPSIRSREIDDETVIIDKYTGEIHQLNPTASYIWDALDGTASLNAISQHYAIDFDLEPERALKDINAIVESLLSLGLLVKSEKS